MGLSKFLGGAVLAAIFAVLAPAVIAHSEEDYAHMGPLDIMWPPNREWNEDEARTAPCGTPDGAGDRTDFPLNGASLALEQKDEVYAFEVYISLSEDPESNDDFELISDAIPSLDWSHVCINSPTLPRDASASQPATLQFRYEAPYHSHKRHPSTNETFYLCSDLTLVPAQAFTYEIPCFNVSASDADGHSHDGHSHHSSQEEGVGVLTGRVITGIVVGCTVGPAIIAGVVWFFWRRRRMAREAAMKEEIERQNAVADRKLRGLGSRQGSLVSREA